jgi:hypothetical protein
MVVVIATTESAITFGWLKMRSAGEGMPHFLGERRARAICVGTAAASIYQAVRCIVGATHHDWAACLFYAITTAAGVGILSGFASSSRRWVQRNEEEARTK